ncbi:Beta-lactamase [Roseomonas mucosa]|uniref:class A beta-lactamase n=1 Tax=Roseomonas TaxID=125216 RepID=UPI000966EE2A|nr:MULTISPECIES: class A beta-lactamase [Roseomonas]ATR22172.1 class A beta-lactamase [Roseomonas sp. FDAARGOS_362]USQ73319.1 class A beta-lactamase [Roseomonas mucosa]UZO95317.1 Beta-lactamase [Roseomonas mucosa]GAV33183.1 beta-lactamase precursor [Roseomonas sp. TAS13]
MIGRRMGMGAMAALGLGMMAAGPSGARAASGAGKGQAGAGFSALPAVFAGIERRVGGRLGVAVLDTATGQRAGHREAERFPLTSTFKLLAAAAVLSRVDAGQARLDQRIRYGREKLVAYSPETEKHAGEEGMTLAAICEAAVTLSDNTAGNLMLEQIGGPAGLTAWLRSIGDTVTRLDRWETALNEAEPGDPRDTTSPAAMLASLQRVTLGEALSVGGQAHLTGWLRANKTGDKRLRAGLPGGWQAGDKTGAGERGTNNDAGLLWPPGESAPILVAAYSTGGTAPSTERDAALAEVAAAIVAAKGP